MTAEAEQEGKVAARGGQTIVLYAGHFGTDETLRSVLQLVGRRQDVAHGVLRILSKDARGHIGFEGNTIIGAHATDTNEYGPRALQHLLGAARGVFGYLSLPQQAAELRQSWRLPVQALLLWHPQYGDPAAEPSLQEAAKALLSHETVSAEIKALQSEGAASQLAKDADTQFAAYLAWGEVPALNTNLATLIPAAPKPAALPNTSPINPDGASASEMRALSPGNAFSGFGTASPSPFQKLADAVARITGRHTTLKGLTDAAAAAATKVTGRHSTIKSISEAAAKGIADAAARVTGRHSTLKATKAEAPVERKSTSQKLKVAAALGVDLTTASHRLKTMTEEEAKLTTPEQQRMRSMTALLDDDEEDIEPVRQVKSISLEFVIGATIIIILAVVFEQQVSKAFQYRNHFRAGLAALKDGKPEIAQAEFTASIVAEPSNSNLYCYRAMSEAKQGNSDAALSDYARAIELDPDNPQAYVARASLYDKKNQFDLAIADCDAAINLDASYIDAYLVRGNAFNAQKRYSEAIGDANLVLKRSSKEDKRRSDALSIRAYAYYQKNELEDCIKDYTAALAAAPGNAELYASRGVVYSKLNKWQQAVDDCNVAIALLPTDASLYVLRAQCYRALGVSEKVMKYFDQEIKDHPTVGNHLARAQARMAVHEFKGAMEDYKYVLDQKPNDAVAKSGYDRAKAGADARRAYQMYCPRQ